MIHFINTILYLNWISSLFSDGQQFSSRNNLIVMNINSVYTPKKSFLLVNILIDFLFSFFMKIFKINSILKFNGFPQKSKIPVWLREIILSSSDDHLRKFLVFVTGSPSISSSSRGKMEINVRCQARSGLLPVAHTCFFHLGMVVYNYLISIIFAQSIFRFLIFKFFTFLHSSTNIWFLIIWKFFWNFKKKFLLFFFFFFLSNYLLDIPDYREKEILWNKLNYAIDNATTFEIVWCNYTKQHFILPGINIHEKFYFFISFRPALVIYIFDIKYHHLIH